MNPFRTSRCRQKISSRFKPQGAALLEVLVGLAILMTGLLLSAAIFPASLEAQREAEVLAKASFFAQMKVEEIRRDDTADHVLYQAIVARDTPTSPITFTQDSRLTYSFSGRSMQYLGDPTDTSDPRGADGTGRVIIRYAPKYRPTEDVIYELRFGEN
jgi:type II secretory pathway pseudopilin PulG